MNHYLKRTIAAVSACCLAFSLAACGKGSEKPVNNNVSSAPEEHPEFAYVSEITHVQTSQDSFYPRLVGEKGIYGSSWVKVGENIPEGVTPEWEGQYDVYETRLFILGYDGKVSYLEGYKPVGVETSIPNADTSCSLNALAMAHNGDLLCIEDTYVSWSEAPEDTPKWSDEWYSYYRSEEHFYLRHLNPDGTEKSTVELVKPDDVEYFYPYYLVEDNSGRIYVGSDQSVLILDGTGRLIKTVNADRWYSSLVLMPDGNSVGGTYWDDAKNGYQLGMLDVAKGEFTDPIALPENCYELIRGGGDYNFYYNSGTSLYGLDVASGEFTRIFSWLSCDIDVNDVVPVITADGTIYTVTNEWNWEDENTLGSCSTDLVKITKVPYDSVPHKQTITYAIAGAYLDYNVTKEIVKFNRTNNEVRIDVKEYENTDVLLTEMMAGKMPDIIDLNSVDEVALSRSGLLEDLYPYIDQDPEFKRSDFNENLFKALEKDGKLLRLVPNYNIYTLAVSSSVVGDRNGWTFDDVQNVLKTMPEGCTFLSPYVTRSEIINLGLSVDDALYIDRVHGSCDFDNDAMKQLLTFAKTFPAEFNWDTYDYVDDRELLSQGKQLATTVYLSSIDDIMQYDGIFGGSTNFIGYPNAEGRNGSMYMVYGGVAMTTGAKDKDAVWTFMRSLLTKEYQGKLNYNLPTRWDCLEEMLVKAMTPEFQKDQDGKYILDENGKRIEIPKYVYWYGDSEDTRVEVYAMTMDQANQIRNLTKSASGIMNWNGDEIQNIVTEEAEAFFAGQKTVDEVVRLIQSRANIYINEQM